MAKIGCLVFIGRVGMWAWIRVVRSVHLSIIDPLVLVIAVPTVTTA